MPWERHSERSVPWFCISAKRRDTKSKNLSWIDRTLDVRSKRGPSTASRAAQTPRGGKDPRNFAQDDSNVNGAPVGTRRMENR